MPSRPHLSVGGKALELDGQLAGSNLLGAGLPADWMDTFMQHIQERRYDAARECLRSAVARGINDRVASQYAKVLEAFLQRRDAIENPIILAKYGKCVVREIDEVTGRGLVVPGYASWGDELWNERPLMYIQSPGSRKAALVCNACLAPIGSLATQLAHLGLPVPVGADAVLLQNDGNLCAPVPCSGQGCKEVFCSEACRAWALDDAAHALLCAGRMTPEQREALDSIEALAVEADHEHLLLLAHGIAQMLLCRHRGQSTEDILHRFAGQFASRPWDELAEPESSSPPAGEAPAADTPEVRRGLLQKVSALLCRLFGDDELAAPMLEPKILSGLLGTFELVNMCISLPHPLNSVGERLCELLDNSTMAKLAETQRGVEDDSDNEEDEDGSSAAGSEQPEQAPEGDVSLGETRTAGGLDPAAEAAVEAARNGTLFANVIGTALCEALAFTNHSCLPNCRIDFATQGMESSHGPGLWVYAITRRPLIPGDEVLMSYVPSVVGKPLKVRQERMKKFGFPCRCRSCITDEMLEAEDAIHGPM